jgi:hypothetical protein
MGDIDIDPFSRPFLIPLTKNMADRMSQQSFSFLQANFLAFDIDLVFYGKGFIFRVNVVII